jgi:hypothetical protein
VKATIAKLASTFCGLTATPANEVCTDVGLSVVLANRYDLAIDVTATDTNASVRFDALMAAPANASGSQPDYIPILFVNNEKVTKEDESRLALCASVLIRWHACRPSFGRILHGSDFRIRKVKLAPPKTPEEDVAAVKGRYGPFADKLIAAYPPGSGRVAKTARDLTRDAAFGWHTWIWARLEAQSGKSKVFYYCFDQHPEYPADSPRAGYGSPHGADVAYVFQRLNSSNPQITKSDIAISDAMATYWTNFAKRGDPNGEGVPAWPAFSDAKPVVMYFAQTPHAGPVPSAEGLQILDAYFTWRRTPEGEAWAK